MQFGGPHAVYVDGSFGQGGHAAEILRRLAPDGRLIAFDVDPRAGQLAMHMAALDTRLDFHGRRSSELGYVANYGVAGIVLDLSPQMTAAEERARGLSFVEAVPLDGRIGRNSDGRQLKSAAVWLQTVSLSELAFVLQEYGEEWVSPLQAYRLAEAILHRQTDRGPYRSTLELADVCVAVKGLDDRGLHPAKLPFQAIRAFLNEELEELRKTLEVSLKSLQVGGRLVVLTTRRREATEVKRFIREFEAPDMRFAEFVTPQRFAELFPLAATDLPYACRQLCEPIRASALEVSRNPRAKAALLHVLQKEERPLGPCDELGVLGLVPRPLHQQFRKPTPLPFHGSNGSFQSDAQDPRDIGQTQALPRKN
ncbi:rsmH [Symbiodinium sp. KB8]|nr:rsmH [Symbiodinium sp. KB8]